LTNTATRKRGSSLRTILLGEYLMTRKQADRATHVEIIAIHEKLKEGCTKLDGGMCTYAAGISDQSIADALGVAKSSVQNVRQQMFGKLRTAPADEARIETIIMQNEFLKEQHERLGMIIAESIRRFNSLVHLLAQNRAADCKHLHLSGDEVRKFGALSLDDVRKLGGSQA
jgi:hypothetical protein